MKRYFFPLLILFLFVLYYFPILHETPDTNQNKGLTEEPTLMSDMDKVYPLPVSGYEHYIGKPIEDYQSRYGEPDSVVSNEDGTQWWSYSETVEEYLQLEVSDSLIQSIFVLGDQVNTGSLRIGMSRENVFDETQLAKHFYFDHENRSYHLTLSTKNMELFPLVEFENNSFAVLYFYPETDIIYAIRFLTYDKIMQLNYYFIEDMNSQMDEVDIIRKDIHRNDQINQLHLQEYFSIIRVKNNLEPYLSSEELENIADSLANDLGSNQLLYKELSPYKKSEIDDSTYLLKYISGNQIYDSAMQLGLFYAIQENREMLLNEEYKEFIIKVKDDDLFIVIKE